MHAEMVKRAAAERQKMYRRQKLYQQVVVGSTPLPPDMELPAVLGGQMPPRTARNTERRKKALSERELEKRRRKGLRDDSDSESEERRFVRLPRSTLLSITTPQMTHFVKFLRATVDLTPSQQDELAKQKRQVKNRESASRFRARRELNNVELQSKLAALQSEVVRLRAENQKLRAVIQTVVAEQRNAAAAMTAAMATTTTAAAVTAPTEATTKH